MGSNLYKTQWFWVHRGWIKQLACKMDGLNLMIYANKKSCINLSERHTERYRMRCAFLVNEQANCCHKRVVAKSIIWYHFFSYGRLENDGIFWDHFRGRLFISRRIIVCRWALFIWPCFYLNIWFHFWAICKGFA